jgi:cardiolipin synthase A/B
MLAMIRQFFDTSSARWGSLRDVIGSVCGSALCAPRNSQHVWRRANVCDRLPRVKLKTPLSWTRASSFRFGKRKPRVETFVEGNHVELLRAGLQSYERMLQAIDQAHICVWLEMYWFAADDLGQRFFQALSRALGRGVSVRVIYDALGSYGTPVGYFEALRCQGARVFEFNPLQPFEKRFHLAKMTLRNHRKLLIVDAAVAFTGGTNISSHWLSVEDGGGGWRDEVVQVTGPVVHQLGVAFAASFLETAGEPIEVLPEVRPLGEDAVAVLTQGTFPRRRQALHAYLWRLTTATKSIYVANAYFIPEGRLGRALRRAARRGVDVRVMCPGLSDVAVVSLASRHTWEKLLNSGVRLFEWNKTVFHSKTAVVDGEWTTAGSFNLDGLSLRNNRELNISVLSHRLAQEAEAQFLSDCSLCDEVDAAKFRNRPWAEKTAESMAYSFRAWL